MPRYIAIALVLAFVQLSAPSTASADTIWGWSFNETNFVVGPTDSIALQATVFNSPLSTEPIMKIGGGSFTGDLQATYDFEWGAQCPVLRTEPRTRRPFLVPPRNPHADRRVCSNRDVPVLL
jgi:hypothetical protein